MLRPGRRVAELLSFDLMNLAVATIEDAVGIAEAHIRSWQVAYAEILDGSWLTSLSVEKRAEKWQEILAAGESETVVSADQTGITGFVSFGHCRDEQAPQGRGEIWALYVHPDAWGKGHGRSLLQYAIRALHESGFQDVSLWVLSKNQRGIDFYEAHGFGRVEGVGKLLELGGRKVEEVQYVRKHGA